MDNRGSKPWKKSLSQRNARLIEKYNRTAHTLRPLLKGQIVSIQCKNNGRWSTTGQIIETLPHNQYRIRVDGPGRITLRNRRFLRKLETPVTPHPILSPFNGTPILEGNSESKSPALQTTDSETAPQPTSSTNPASSDNADKTRLTLQEWTHPTHLHEWDPLIYLFSTKLLIGNFGRLYASQQKFYSWLENLPAAMNHRDE